MKRVITLLTLCCLSYVAGYAQDEVKVVIPMTICANYALRTF